MDREIFRFAQHPPHTRFDTMGGFFDQYKELLDTLSPCDMVHLSSRSRYVIYPFKPEMCTKKVQVGKDQEKAQSEKDSHSKNRGGKKPQQSGTYTMKTFRRPNEQLFSQ